MIAIRWSGTLIEIPRNINVLEKEGRKLIVVTLKRFNNGGQQHAYKGS